MTFRPLNYFHGHFLNVNSKEDFFHSIIKAQKVLTVISYKKIGAKFSKMEFKCRDSKEKSIKKKINCGLLYYAPTR